MEIDNQLINVSINAKNANQVKTGVIEKLFELGILTEEQAFEFVNEWQVLIVKKKWYHTWFEAIKKFKVPEMWVYVYVKMGNSKFVISQRELPETNDNQEQHGEDVVDN